jgi:hypothetical protein
MLLAASQQASSFSPLHYTLHPPCNCMSHLFRSWAGHTSSFHLHQLTPAGSDNCLLPRNLYTATNTTSPLQQEPNDFIFSSATILLALLLVIVPTICTEKNLISSCAAAYLTSKRGIERNLVSACNLIGDPGYAPQRPRSTTSMHNSFPSPTSSLIEGFSSFHDIS